MCSAQTASSTDSKPCASAARPVSSVSAGWARPPALHELVDSGEFHGFQCYYNLLNPSAGQPVPKNFSAQDYGLILDRAAAKGMGAFIIRVLAAGALTADPSAGGGGSGQTLSPGSDYPLDLQRAEKVKTALGVDGKRSDASRDPFRFDESKNLHGARRILEYNPCR